MYTKNALGNLKNRYKAVLKKCNLLNAFGSLALVASLLCAGTPSLAGTPEVTLTTTEYVEADASNYYATYAVPTYDTVNGTYILETRGVLLKGGGISILI